MLQPARDEHFVRKFAAQMKKSIISVPSKTMEMLVRWNGPGNTRELENFLEPSAILTPGRVVRAPRSEFQTAVHQAMVGVRAASGTRNANGFFAQSHLDQVGIKPGGCRA
jgi:DNA-binding NtrC family response regulator